MSNVEENKVNDTIPSNNKNNENNNNVIISKIGTISELDSKLPIISSTPQHNSEVSLNLESKQHDEQKQQLTLPDIFTKPYDNVDKEAHSVLSPDRTNAVPIKQNEPIIINESKVKFLTNKTDVNKADTTVKPNNTTTPRKINVKEAKQKNVNFSSQGKIKDDILTITLLENGDTVITSKKSDKVLEDHTANFFALSSLAAFKDFDVGYHQMEKNTNSKSRIDFIKELKTLIKFCLNALKGFSMETLSKDITLFQVNNFASKTENRI